MAKPEYDTFENRLFLTTPQLMAIGIFVIVEIAFLVISIISKAVPYGLILLVSLLLFAGTLLIVFLLRKGVGYVKEKEAKVTLESEWKHDTLLQVEEISANCSVEEPALTKRLYEAIKYSDPISVESAVFTEGQITEALDEILRQGVSEERIENVESLIRRRNAICKSDK